MTLLTKRSFFRAFCAVVLAIQGIAISVAAAAHAPVRAGVVSVAAPGHEAGQANHDELRCPLCIFAMQQQSPGQGAVAVADAIVTSPSMFVQAEQPHISSILSPASARAPPFLNS